MALPPGLLPEESDSRPSRTPLVLGGVVFAALLALGAVLVQNQRLSAERDDALAQLAAARKRPVEAPPPPAPVAPPSEAPPRIVIVDAPAPAPAPPAKAPAVRVLPVRDDEPSHLTRGLHEFRSGRYEQAERQFFRAFPDSLLYLSLSSFAQQSWREAATFLARAMAADPKWLQRVNPRDLFGKAADFEALLAELDDQMAKNPLDADLKTLAAYVRYHEKGAPYAKALLIEAVNAVPDHAAAKAFLEALGP